MLANAKRPFVAANGEKSRQKFEYQCAICGGWFPQKEVSVDHIIPVGTLRSLEDLPGFVERLFVGVDKLQVLCDTDHQIKTNKEREERKNAQL